MQITVTVAVLDTPTGEDGLVFPEPVARDAVHQLRGKPVYSSRTGRKVGEVVGATITQGDGTSAQFTPGHRKVNGALRLVATIELQGDADPTGLQLTPLWEGQVSPDDKHISRARLLGGLISRAGR